MLCTYVRVCLQCLLCCCRLCVCSYALHLLYMLNMPAVLVRCPIYSTCFFYILCMLCHVFWRSGVPAWERLMYEGNPPLSWLGAFELTSAHSSKNGKHKTSPFSMLLVLRTIGTSPLNSGPFCVFKNLPALTSKPPSRRTTVSTAMLQADAL